MRTHAAIVVEQGKPMVIDDLELPDPGPTQVLVKQFASGVCHSQLHELNRPVVRTPMILGHESTGIVVAKGSEVTHVKEGDNVMLTWVPRGAAPGLPQPQVPPLNYKGETVNYGAPVSTGVFTWAADTIADEQFVVPLEEGVATDGTAIVGCAVMTGCGAVVNAAMVRAGESVAVIGVGGVGLCIVQAAANVGAYPIIAVDLTDEKTDFAKKFGASIGVNASEGDAVEKVRELTGGGVDYAFDAIGARITIEQSLLAARPRRPGDREGGTAIVVGVPHGEAPTPAMNMIFGGKVYRGAPGGCSRPDRDFPMFVRWFKEGKLPLDLLVTKRYKLEQINEACDDLAHGQIAGRSIIEF